MKIRTQFIITTSLFAIMLIVVAASVLITNQQVQRLDAQEEIARRIEQGTTELTYLAGDYLLHGESQQRARWESRFASFSADLLSLAPGDAEAQALASNIKANAQRLRAVFTEVASTMDGAQGQDPLSTAFVQVSWSRMAVQNQGISFDASRLSRQLNRQASQTKQTNIMLVLALIAVFAAYFTANYLLMFRRTLKSLAELHAGARTIGSGNLDFTIAEKRADEIGDLSRAFNRMTANLKSVTASKADLERQITERKKAEEALKQSEEKYRSLFTSMSTGYAYCKIEVDAKDTPVDFTYIEVNDAFERLTGLSKASVTGKKVTQAIPGIKEQNPEIITTYGNVALTGAPTAFEVFFGPLQIWLTISVYSPRKGYFVALFDNITERKGAEERAIRQKEIQEAINRVLEATVACATEEDLGRVCLTIAERLTESKFGFIGKVNSPGRLDDIAISDPGWEACQIEAPVGHGRLPRGFTIHGIYGRVLLDGKAFFTNDPASHPDRIGLPEGHPPLTSFLGIPLIGEGKTTGMLALGNREGGYRPEDQQAAEALAPAIVEAIQRKQAESQLVHLASFPQLNPMPVIEVDAAGNIKYLNPAAMAHIPALSTLGRNHPFLAGWEGLVNNLQSGAARSFTRDVNAGDSWWEQTVAYVPSTRDFRIYGRDITERKRAEEEIKGLVAELSRRATDLEASNREMESFSYSVSHDLRAPLRSMDGFSTALLEDYADRLDEQGKDWLRRIRASSQLMAQLIDDILGLSRVVRAELQLQRVNLSDTASAIAERLKSAQPERHVEFDIMPNIEARGDANLLRLALENLLGNAFKFTARRQTARIEFGASEQDGATVYFVRDNGAGFDMQYAEKLFRPFQRLHSEKEFTGTGIGLATVQRIIKRHGGNVWAEGEPGKGSTFHFTLAQGGK
ncbi:MAG: GAF domain-containing protein [Chloroflexi bacterium]|nr:GAF domain-containing protein [Chloroflexota bacterium]